MRYIDTGARHADHALGAWLEALAADTSVVAFRCQSGFFVADSLGHLVDVLQRLASSDGVVRVLVGSNDGTTRQSDLEVLLGLVSPLHRKRQIGVVAFENAYFHSKTFHFTRSDGSEAGYVGSANLTRSGVASLHVEAGVVLDTRDGDDPAILNQIGAAVDWWFDGSPPGLELVSDASDVKDLVQRRIINVPRPLPVHPHPSPPSETTSARARLAPLRSIPILPLALAAGVPPPADGAPTDCTEGSAGAGTTVDSGVTTALWTKTLTRSDAQRKARGHQRGGITLVAAGYPIDAQTYFRYDFFVGAEWCADTTRTGQGRETVIVQFTTTVLGNHVGLLDIPITYAPNREASQANYTTLLHLGPLAPHFAADDLTDRVVALERRPDSSYILSIS